MQAEMVNNVTESVLEKLQQHLDDQEARMVLQVEEVGKELKNQGMSNQKQLEQNIQTLEGYIQAIHQE